MTQDDVGARPRPHAAAEAARRVRTFLDDAGYSPGGMRSVLRTDEVTARPRELPVYLRRLEAAPEPLGTLLQLFLLGRPVAAATAKTHFGAMLDELERAGLVAVHDEVEPLLRLVPHDDLIVASDRAERSGPDFVAGLHRPSWTLANLTLRDPVSRALDVGTGNGIQALLVSRHAEHVVATDVNERALAFAAFNAALNGVDNVEFRSGSFLEPVAGERFDLVVANPPYVISPESEYLFRDSGLGRDRVSENLVRALPTVLAKGAHATIMVSWIQSGDDATARPREWLDGSRCDAFVIHAHAEDALAAAAEWNRDADTREEYAERVGRWADYYRDEGIDAVGYAAIVLRRRDGDNFVRALELPPRRFGPADDQLRRLFAAQDFLAEEPQLLDHRFSFAPDARLEHTLAPAADGWESQQAALVLEQGLGYRIGIDAKAARLVTALRPDRPLDELLAAAAATIDTDAEAVRRAGENLVRKLLELGFLEPALTFRRDRA